MDQSRQDFQRQSNEEMPEDINRELTAYSPAL